MASRFLANLSVLLLLIGSFSCHSHPVSEKTLSAAKVPLTKAENHALQIERWPPDYKVSIEDTTIQFENEYRLQWTTYSLNDNAVLDTVSMFAAHNWQTELKDWKNGQLLFKCILDKQTLGRTRYSEPYAWNNVFYRGCRNHMFIFEASLCIPDSDICENAEVTVDERGIVHFVKWLEQESME
ncbi:hypothetical protein [Hymenobacter crusticola]|uniref:Uncharacterized protein n=1 Tax=Hymenobacter crusticola TaxID=1770526 RepID=A0A243WI09_9BACT|nr:hypothetical protein [Hymenobacter crusticola]OUJ75476.1 hypothetical protein BXP70_05545 [Hymenobacter crusticola]